MCCIFIVYVVYYPLLPSILDEVVMGEWIRFIVFGIFALFIGIIDLKTLKIPNYLLISMAFSLLLFDFLWNFSLIPLYLLSGLGAFGLFFAVFWLRGGLGFGDVKYAALIGYFLGPRQFITGLLCAVILGMVYWCIGYTFLQWTSIKRFPFGPWLSCGAIISGIFYRRML